MPPALQADELYRMVVVLGLPGPEEAPGEVWDVVRAYLLHGTDAMHVARDTHAHAHSATAIPSDHHALRGGVHPGGE